METVRKAETNYKLVGGNFTSEELQKALYDAGRILTLEDYEALVDVCGWFSEHNIKNDFCNRVLENPPNRQFH